MGRVILTCQCTYSYWQLAIIVILSICACSLSLSLQCILSSSLALVLLLLYNTPRNKLDYGMAGSHTTRTSAAPFDWQAGLFNSTTIVLFIVIHGEAESC